VLDRDTRQRRVWLTQVDDAPVGDIGHGQPGHGGERGLVIDRLGEQSARLGQEPQPLRGNIHTGCHHAGGWCKRETAEVRVLPAADRRRGGRGSASG
jgi:hypothetical protein